MLTLNSKLTAQEWEGEQERLAVDPPQYVRLLLSPAKGGSKLRIDTMPIPGIEGASLTELPAEPSCKASLVAKRA